MDNPIVNEVNTKKAKINLWHVISIVLLVLLVVSIFTSGFKFNLNKNEAASKAVNYIKSLPSIGSVVLNDVSNEKNVYKLSLNVDGQTIQSYITKDGSLLFPTGLVILDSNDVGSAGSAAPQNSVSPQSVKVDTKSIIDDDPMLGSKDAKVTIVEFSDFQCPFCRSFWRETLSKIKTEYVDTGKARIVYRDFPLSFHPASQPAAESAECADEQGKFWEFHDKVFGEQDKQGQGTIQFGVTELKKWAKEIGLDEKKFNECLDSGKYKDEVQKDLSDGSALGVSGTPAFFINGQELVGAQPYESFKSVIDSELQK